LAMLLKLGGIDALQSDQLLAYAQSVAVDCGGTCSGAGGVWLGMTRAAKASAANANGAKSRCDSRSLRCGRQRVGVCGKRKTWPMMRRDFRASPTQHQPAQPMRLRRGGTAGHLGQCCQGGPRAAQGRTQGRTAHAPVSSDRRVWRARRPCCLPLRERRRRHNGVLPLQAILARSLACRRLRRSLQGQRARACLRRRALSHPWLVLVRG
jgi:hypothetical protein